MSMFFGEITQPLPQQDYVGKDSKYINVNIDNSARTITAELSENIPARIDAAELSIRQQSSTITDFIKDANATHKYQELRNKELDEFMDEQKRTNIEIKNIHNDFVEEVHNTQSQNEDMFSELDTKIDKSVEDITKASDNKYVPKLTPVKAYSAYVIEKETGNHILRSIYSGDSASASPYSILARDWEGYCKVMTPRDSTHIANKYYVDAAVSNKVDKLGSDSSTRVYAVTENGEQIAKSISSNADSKLTLLTRNSSGFCSIKTPESDMHIANKLYADSVADAVRAGVELDLEQFNELMSARLEEKVTKEHANGFDRVYGVDTSDTQCTFKVSGTSVNYTLVYRNGDGTAEINNPRENLHIANKAYVDSVAEKKVNKLGSGTGVRVYAVAKDGSQIVKTISSNAGSKGTLMTRDENGFCGVPTPIDAAHIANKQYVDTTLMNSIDGFQVYLDGLQAQIEELKEQINGLRRTITFTVQGTDYTVYEGTTWQEWCDEHPGYEFYCTGGTVYYGSDSSQYVYYDAYDSEQIVDGSDYIQDGMVYWIYGYTEDDDSYITVTIDGVTYSVSEGTSWLSWIESGEAPSGYYVDVDLTVMTDMGTPLYYANSTDLVFEDSYIEADMIYVSYPDGVEPFVFTVTDTCYATDPSYTWTEWINSKYNTPGFFIDAEGQVATPQLTILCDEDDHTVYKDFVISSYSKYTEITLENIDVHFMISSVRHTAQYGMTWAEWCETDDAYYADDLKYYIDIDPSYSVDVEMVCAEGVAIRYADGNFVPATDVIIPNYEYQ